MNLRGSEWIIILVVVVLLFGAKKLPDTARGLGRSLRIFRSEVRGMSDDEKAAKSKELPASDTAEPGETH